MSKRPLVPSFLQKADDKLLRNKPGTWASRAHLVLYFVAVFALLLFVFCYFVFFDAKQYSNVGIWNVLVGLLAFVGFVFWLIYLLRFNVFKRYGNWSAMDGLRDFGLYFISIGAMVAVCFVPSAVETMRANQQFGNEEIVKDINELNINACRLEYNLLPLEWGDDSCHVVNSTSTMPPSADPAAYDTVVNVSPDHPLPYRSYYHTIDTAELRSKLISTDSVIKINDSLYIFYECPNYRFVSSYNADDYSTVKILSSAAIYNGAIKNYKKPDRNVLLKRMQELKNKYAVNSRYYYGDYDRIDENDIYDTKINKKYDLTRISNGIDNAVRKKQAWIDDWPVFIRVFYYITLLLTMLIFIFRHSTAKTFFLSVLAAVLLTIISGLIMVVTRGEEASGYSFILVYYVLFAVLALSIFKTDLRRAAQGIGLNLFLFMTPFIPLIFVALNRAREYRDLYIENEYEVRDPQQMAMYYLIAEIAGSVILLILIQPLFKRLYRKWYSSPEE
ncbi:MAG: hypothetical protein ABI685_09210 [Ferruginibacter sp.]